MKVLRESHSFPQDLLGLGAQLPRSRTRPLGDSKVHAPTLGSSSLRSPNTLCTLQNPVVLERLKNITLFTRSQEASGLPSSQLPYNFLKPTQKTGVHMWSAEPPQVDNCRVKSVLGCPCRNVLRHRAQVRDGCLDLGQPHQWLPG